LGIALLLTQAIQAQVSQKKTNDSNFGIKLGVNYSMLGASYASFNGAAMPIIGMFYTKPALRFLDVTGEFGFSAIRVKKNQSDTRYNYSYLDGTLIGTLYPSGDNNDFAFLLGFRASYLMSYSTEVFTIGNYTRTTDPTNLNEQGSMAYSALVGMSVRLSPIVNIELTYLPTLNSSNIPQSLEGRPSTIEIGIRLNASGIRMQSDQEISTNKLTAQAMKNGAAFVMLTTVNENEIKALRDAGLTADAEEIELEMKLRNLAIAKAFRENFNLSKLYFFYDSTASKIQRGDFRNVFLDKNLQPSSSIVFNDSQSYYIVSFCEDISAYTDRTQFGLYVYDDNFIQLPKPFNTPSQLISPVLEGDPLNYFKKRRYNFSLVPFEKYITKLQARINRLLIDY
jgi:hypothetical protein